MGRTKNQRRSEKKEQRVAAGKVNEPRTTNETNPTTAASIHTTSVITVVEKIPKKKNQSRGMRKEMYRERARKGEGRIKRKMSRSFPIRILESPATRLSLFERPPCPEKRIPTASLSISQGQSVADRRRTRSPTSRKREVERAREVAIDRPRFPRFSRRLPSLPAMQIPPGWEESVRISSCFSSSFLLRASSSSSFWDFFKTIVIVLVVMCY